MSGRRWLVVLALAAAPATVEAGVLRAVGLVTALGLAPQASAIAPYGTFHDVRWILVYHESWLGLAAEVLAAVLLRTAWAVAMTVAAWPPAEGRPPVRRLVGYALGFHAVAIVISAPWATVAMAASETSLSWFLIGEVLPVLVLGLVLTRGGVVPGWWRGAPGILLAGWGLAGFAAATVASVVVGFTPDWWSVPVAGATATVNGWLWRQAVRCRAPVTRGWARPPVPLLVVGGLLAAMLGAGKVATFAVRGARQPIPPVTGPGVAAVDVPVIYVSGYDSQYRPGVPTQGLPLVYFSYRGVDGQGRPLPYEPQQTHRALATSAALLDRQVSLLHARTGRPVALVAQSEGTLVVRAYLQRVAHPPVSAVALLSPLVRPARVYIPPPQARAGWGIAAGWVLRGMLAVVRVTGGPAISADEPFVRSVLDNGVLYRDRMLCPVPGVRMVAFIPLASAVVVPPGRYSAVPVIGLPGLHAQLLGRADVQRDLLSFLAGRSAGKAPGWPYPVVQKAAAAWQAPALALRVNPVWHAAGQPDAAFDEDGCAARPGRPG